jgi:TM2 domain-containing membrane protein YozV
LLCLFAWQGNGKLIFQGCISYVACILITYLGFAMLRFGNIEQKYARKLDGAARSVSPAAADVYTALGAGL